MHSRPLDEPAIHACRIPALPRPRDSVAWPSARGEGGRRRITLVSPTGDEEIRQLDQKMRELGRKMRAGFVTVSIGMVQLTALLTQRGEPEAESGAPC